MTEKEVKKMEIDLVAQRIANAGMAEVLHKYGIRAVPLRLTYIESDCQNCTYSMSDDGSLCEVCGGPETGNRYVRETTTIESEAFFAYEIKGGAFDGINAEFRHEGYDLLKAVDDRTGEVIYEKGKR